MSRKFSREGGKIPEGWKVKAEGAIESKGTKLRVTGSSWAQTDSPLPHPGPHLPTVQLAYAFTLSGTASPHLHKAEILPFLAGPAQMS